jgi:hypothetical protein
LGHRQWSRRTTKTRQKEAHIFSRTTESSSREDEEVLGGEEGG